MKTTTLRNIMTIILVTLPVLKSIRISLPDRVEQYLKVKNLKFKIINNYLRHYQTENVYNLLSEYALDKIEMYAFALHIYKTGNLPEWSTAQKLKNPKLYESLRYEIFVELIPSSRDESIELIQNLKLTVFKNAPNISHRRIYSVYVNKKLNEIVSLENYYAINIYLKHNRQITLENPVGWRIRSALYSLAIRQLTPNLKYPNTSKICFTSKLVNSSFVNPFPVGQISKIIDFWKCRSRNMIEESDSSIPVNNDDSFYWISYKIVITDHKLIVSLEEFLKNGEEKFYLFFPETAFNALSSFTSDDTSRGLINYITLETVPVRDNSKWLTEMVNKIEKYKEKEGEYFDNNEIRDESE